MCGRWLDLGLWSLVSFARTEVFEFHVNSLRCLGSNGEARIYCFNFQCNSFSSACFVSMMVVSGNDNNSKAETRQRID